MHSQIHSYSIVFNVCAWATEMDYARKTDRATGQAVKETVCASETVRAMG